VVTVADVFDALISRRPYKDAWPIERALEFIEGQSGQDARSRLRAWALLDNLPRLHDICERYSQVVPQPGIH
jgi:response regulator RpfG family c-di-GMP phosphodiesterase